MNKVPETPRPLTHPQGIIFDIDGVLFDSRDVNLAYYNLARASVGLAPMSKEDEEYCQMASAQQSFERIIPLELQHIALEKIKSTPYNEFALPKLSLEPGLASFLGWLKKNDIQMAVCTNRMSQVERFFEHFGITSFFNPIMTAANSAPKPSPDGLNKIYEIWKLKKESLVFIGDSKVDEEAAKAAGIPFWAFRNPQLDALLHISSFFMLKECLVPLVEYGQ